MNIRKTYMSKYKSGLQIYAYIGGKPVLCEFKNASRFNKNIRGTFTTNNPELIEALEKDSGFNVKYILLDTKEDESGVVDALEVRGMEINPKEEIPEPAPVKKVREVKPEKPSVQVAPSVQVVSKEDVKNVQEAKEWLRRNFKDLTFKKLSNKEIILEVAKEKNVHFEGVE